jgi:hypothetical protein
LAFTGLFAKKIPQRKSAGFTIIFFFDLANTSSLNPAARVLIVVKSIKSLQSHGIENFL